MLQRAFTLIEIMVVITVIAVLAGLLFAAGNTINQRSKSTHSKVVIGIVANALSACEASGQPVNLAEHPLAGSSGTITYFTTSENPGPPYPRPRFLRESPADESSNPLSLTGEAYALPSGVPRPGEDPFNHFSSGYRTRVMLPTDRFHDEGEVPHLYGMQRERLGIIGAGLWNITWYRQLPQPVPPVIATLVPIAGINGKVPRYNDEVLREVSGPRSGILLERLGWQIPGYWINYTVIGSSGTVTVTNMISGVTGGSYNVGNYGGRVTDHIKAFQQTLGSAGALTELTSLGAVSAPTPGTDEVVPIASNDSLLFRKKRAWYDPAMKAKWNTGIRDNWREGLIKDPDVNKWKPYRLRGPAIYDPWGTELLIARGASGRYTITSAGRDRCFQWHPGQDGVFQTPANASLAAGNDRQADRDNVTYMGQ